MVDNTGEILFLIFFYGSVISSFILWIWALADILSNKFETDLIKLIWILILFFIPFFGIIFYFFIGRKQKINKEVNDYE